MPNGEPYTTTEVCRLLGVTPQTIDRYLKRGTIRPMRRATGKGTRHVFSHRDVVALGVGMALARRGVPEKAYAKAIEVIQRADLDLCFGEQKEWLVIFGAECFAQLTRDPTSTFGIWAATRNIPAAMFHAVNVRSAMQHDLRAIINGDQTEATGTEAESACISR